MPQSNKFTHTHTHTMHEYCCSLSKAGQQGCETIFFTSWLKSVHYIASGKTEYLTEKNEMTTDIIYYVHESYNTHAPGLHVFSTSGKAIITSGSLLTNYCEF